MAVGHVGSRQYGSRQTLEPKEPAAAAAKLAANEVGGTREGGYPAKGGLKAGLA